MWVAASASQTRRLAPDNLRVPLGVRVAVEAASVFGWERYVGENGAVVGMTTFGASAPAEELYKHFGITAEAVTQKVRERLK